METMDTVRKDLLIVFVLVSLFVGSIVAIKIYDNRTNVIEKIGKSILKGILE